MNRKDDQEHKDWLLECYTKQQSGRSARYRELLSVLKPGFDANDAALEWAWLNDAIKPVGRAG